MNRLWRASPLTKMLVTILCGFVIAILIFAGSIGIAKLILDL